MAGKTYEIAFKLAGQLSSNFSKTFRSAQDAVKGFNSRISELNKETAQNSGLLKAAQKANQLGQAYGKAKTNVRALEAQLADARGELKRLSTTTKATQEEVKLASVRYEENKLALQRMRMEMAKAEKPTAEMKLAVKEHALALKKEKAELDKKRQALKELSAASANVERLEAAFKKESRAVEVAKQKLDEQRTSLKSLKSAAGITDSSIASLTKRQEELAQATERARQAQAKLAKLNAQGQRAASAQEKLRGGATTSAGTLAAMGAAATGAVGLPVKEAMAMEDAMAEVKKVVDFDTPDGLQKLQAELELMSTRIPMSADALAQIAAAAGQSGIAAKDLTSFTEQAAKMGVAFDITAEEAGTMMSKWQSGMGLTLDQTYKLADATNFLSNSNAAQAKQIGEVLQRYGALGKVAGLSETQTAAFAASVVASGAESEVAATGIKAFMRAMGKGGSMSKVQAAAFKNVGLDPKQLQKNLQKDAPKAIIDTLEAIQKTIPKEKWNQYLSAMFGEEAAVAVGPMMQNLDGLKKNFAAVGDESNYTGSMLKEFESRSATTSNALVIAKNAAMYAARAIGAPLLGPIREAAGAFVQSAISAGQWVKENQVLVMTALKVAGTVTGVIAGFHVLRIALAFLVSPVLSLYRAFLMARKALLWMRTSTMLATAAAKAQRIAMLLWKGTMTAVTAAMKLMRGAIVAVNMAMRANPIGLVVTLLAGLVVAGIAVYKNWDTIKAKLQSLWSTFSERFPALAQVVKNWASSVGKIIENVKGIFSGIISFVKNVFTGNWSAAWQSVKDIFSNTFSALSGIAKAPLNAIIGMVNSVISGINSLGSVKLPDWAGGKSIGINIPSIPHLASGGIATAPTLAMIGEGRESEAVLPLSKLEGLMGVGPGIGGVTVNMTVNVTGAGKDAYEDVRRGISDGTRDLKRELQRLLKDERRVSFV